jgi:exo-beta-1,3-glucanase (GH17 family)
MNNSVLLHIKSTLVSIAFIAMLSLGFSCKEGSNPNNTVKTKEVTAKDILGNSNYLALCYGGYRSDTREKQPTVLEIKEDLKILAALQIKVVRTYNVHFEETSNMLKAIRELKNEDADFEMYVMLGAWIDCKNAWTALEPNHNEESERNATEIEEAVRLANKYPDIVKILAVGNEAMVKWATNYYVETKVILKWVNYLQQLKKEGKLSKELWITSSDNFASWGGGDAVYHTEDLNKLIKAVDYISMHTYPMHDTHYNPAFWKIKENEQTLTDTEKINAVMNRAKEYAIHQYKSVVRYVHLIDNTKAVHIGETGWASSSDGLYGNEGSKATDEYKQALYYNAIREWTNQEGITCFFFEAYDESWKDSGNPLGSENHFGLFTFEGKAKYVLWNKVDEKVFENLKRNGNSISKTYNGNKTALMKTVFIPPSP